MMRALIASSLRFRGLVLVGALALLAGGTVAALRAPIDAFPEFAPPLVEIQTEAPGLAATEVEQLVTVPLENALNGLPLLETMRSKSVSGLSSIVLIFGERTKILEARQLVQERLAAVAARLPQVARPPVLLQPLSATSRIMKIGLTSSTRSQMEMTDVVRWTVRPRLMALPGVANVAIWGERDRQLQILVDPERLRANAVRLDDVLRVARDGVTPSAGGFVDTPNQRLAVTHATSVRVAGDLAALPIRTPGGGLLRLGDVAEIREGFPSPIGDAVVNGQPGLLLIIEKQPAANTLDVTRRVEATMRALGAVMPGIDVDARVFRPATFIERAIRNLADALLIGCVLVVVILALFLYDWRTALISVLAIPLSLVVAVLVLTWAGTTLNTMVLAGLAIALGEVVDDAIIDVENVLRRLRENRALAAPRNALAVVLDASLEVRSAVIYATLIVLAVFLPVFLLDGISGALFRPLGTAYALAVSASLVVALVVTPALALMLLPGAAHRQRRAPLAAWLGRAHRRWLTPLIDRPRAALAILGSLFVLTVAVVPLLGESFLPRFRENDFLMHWVAKPGTSLEALRRTTIVVSKDLLAIPGLRSFGAHLGRAEVADEVVGTNFAELWVSVDPDAPYDETVEAIHRTIAGYAGLRRDVQTYLEERVKEVVAGAAGAIVIRTFGPDLDGLRRHADAVAAAIGGIDGVTNLKVEQQVLVPHIEVRPRVDAAQRMGIGPGELRRIAATLVQSTKVGEIYLADRVVDVVVWGTEALRRDPVAIRELRIDTPLGSAPLGDLADVTISPTPNIVQRERGSRRIDVTCDVRGRDLGAVVRDIRSRLATVTPPPGHYTELLGEHAARSAASTRIAVGAIGSLALVLLILYGDFRSLRRTALIAATLPFALVGGVLAVFITGGVVSLGSLVGFVTVLGIAARNGIMLVSHYRHLVEHEGQTFDRAMILRGTEERLAPIIMTALATGVALIPLALSGNRPGHEIEHPMAVVILGGLVTSTLLNLFLLPPLYLRFGRVRSNRVVD